MSRFRRGDPAYRTAAGVTRLAAGHVGTHRRRTCWVTRRRRGVTRFTRAARAPTRGWFHRGDAWGVTPAGW